MFVSVSEGLPLLEISLLISSSVQRSELSCTWPVVRVVSLLTPVRRAARKLPSPKWKTGRSAQVYEEHRRRLCLAFICVKQIRRIRRVARRRGRRVHRGSRVNPPICISGSGGVRVAPTAAPEDRWMHFAAVVERVRTEFT